MREIARRLRRAYGVGHPARPTPTKRPPLDELILTVLSQNTSDVNRDRAWAAMRKAFRRWRDVLDAPTPDLVRAITPGGLAPTKAPRIKAILGEVLEREGRLSLARLSRLPDDEVRALLQSLPGIGPKTAHCVLAFSLERPALPVDTHVARIAERLGLLPPRASAALAHETLERIVPPSLRVNLHLDLIAHGRTVCRAQRPACEGCPLLDLCPTGAIETQARVRNRTRASRV